MEEADEDITVYNDIELECNRPIFWCVETWRIGIWKASLGVETGIVDENILYLDCAEWTDVLRLFVCWNLMEEDRVQLYVCKTDKGNSRINKYERGYKPLRLIRMDRPHV